MAGGGKAVASGKELELEVQALGEKLGLEVHSQFRVARRIWGAERQIDVILAHKETRKTLGIECKYQSTGGSAEDKIMATIKDIETWPIPGLVVFSGPGFSDNWRSFLASTGKAVELPDLEPWLRLFFGLEIQT